MRSCRWGSSFLFVLLVVGCDSSDPVGADAGPDSAVGTTDAGGGTDGGTLTDSGPYTTLCGLPNTVTLVDVSPWGPSAYLHYTEETPGLVDEACAIGDDFGGGIPSVRFLYLGSEAQAQFRSDWTADSTVGGTLDLGDVICADGVDTTIVAGSNSDARVMTFTVRFDMAANTVAVTSFGISGG